VAAVARSLHHLLHWTADRPEMELAWSAPHNPRWAAPHTSKCACRTPTWPDIFEAAGILPDTASTYCTIFLKARFHSHLHCKEGVSGNPRRSRASRKSVFSRCTTIRQCIAVRWRCRSSKSSTACTKSHGRICRTASRSDRG